MNQTSPNPAPPSAPGRAPDGGRGLDAFGPLVSALLFAYYGFVAGLATHGSAGEPIALWIAFVWVLRIGAIIFAISTALAFLRNPKTDLLYGAGGLFATAALAGVFVWDLVDPNSLAVSPVILLILIVWNGYASIQTLRDALR
jgi:hypothetical protein